MQRYRDKRKHDITRAERPMQTRGRKGIDNPHVPAK
jgi:hypothetical protein